MWENFGDKQNGSFTVRRTKNYEQSTARVETILARIEQENSEHVRLRR